MKVLTILTEVYTANVYQYLYIFKRQQQNLMQALKSVFADYQTLFFSDI